MNKLAEAEKGHRSEFFFALITGLARRIIGPVFTKDLRGVDRC